MNKGQIYKVALKDNEFVGVYVGNFLADTYGVGFTFFTLNGEEIFVQKDEILGLTSVRVSQDIRNSFTEIYNKVKELNDIKETVIDLKRREREVYIELEEAKEMLIEHSGVINVKKLLSEYSQASGWKGTNEGYIVNFSLIIKKQVHATPETNPRLIRNPDGTISLNDKNINFNQKYMPSDLDRLINILNELKFKGSEFKVYLDVHNTVREIIVFNFQFNKDEDINVIKEDLRTIDDWVKRHQKLVNFR